MNLAIPTENKNATETSGPDVDENEKNKHDLEQAAINRKNWEAAPPQHNGHFAVIGEAGVKEAYTDPAPGDMALPSPPMDKRRAIHQVKVSSLTAVCCTGWLNDKETLKKQLFAGYSLANLRELFVELAEKINSTKQYEELGKILGSDCRKIERLGLNISLSSNAKYHAEHHFASSKLVFDSLKHLSNLKELILVFKWTAYVFDDKNVFGSLGKSLEKLGKFNNLEKIQIIMEENSVTDDEMKILFNGISGIKSLRNVEIDMRDSKELTQEGFDHLEGPLRELNNLESLRLVTDGTIETDKLSGALSSVNHLNVGPAA
ncbi:hypothetical protein [Pandoraea faecigallinarum]|nr:hypothetical protein [Pandoraea faecigallinarum]